MNSENKYNGLWMLFGLVVMLSLPLAIGYVLLPAAPAVTVHADATAAH